MAASSLTSSSKILFTNFAVHAVSAESTDVMVAICQFSDGKTSYVGSVDNKHNVKNDRFQCIGGSCVAWIGNHVIDCDLLQQAGLGKDLWRIRDFAPDKLTMA